MSTKLRLQAAQKLHAKIEALLPEAMPEANRQPGGLPEISRG
jgi:hypothetical protein